jgi:hypothetical protein
VIEWVKDERRNVTHLVSALPGKSGLGEVGGGELPSMGLLAFSMMK